jgi:acetyltransferase-like isoleucine patch superfamily enzyme
MRDAKLSSDAPTTVCSHTGLTIPECHCPRCHAALLARYAYDANGDGCAPRAAIPDPFPPPATYRLLNGVEVAPGARISSFTNLYGCRIGAESRIGPFVEIQAGASVGARCKVQSHTFICAGVEIHDEVFVGHGVMFVNDKHPRATNGRGALQQDGEWELLPTVVARAASIGSGAVVLGGVRVGVGALVGAGAVVTRDVAPGATVSGVPARVMNRPDHRS